MKPSGFNLDLREQIDDFPESQVTVIYGGKRIVGTKGNLIQGATFEIDGGGIDPSVALTATFVFDDFPNTPDGTEIVPVNGQSLRIKRITVDDFNSAIVLAFSSIVTE